MFTPRTAGPSALEDTSGTSKHFVDEQNGVGCSRFNFSLTLSRGASSRVAVERAPYGQRHPDTSDVVQCPTDGWGRWAERLGAPQGATRRNDSDAAPTHSRHAGDICRAGRFH